ncbi:MAG: hypothetical protein Q9159_002625 [Coniocarpon cinnabarinum]
MSANLIESAKKAASERAVSDHFDVKSHKRVGIGSGSTIKYVVDTIKETCSREASPPQILFVPTGHGSRELVTNAGLIAIDYETLEPDHNLDVAFDGADEVDADFNLVKGGGACLFQEKLVAARAKKFVVVADFRKDQSHLLTNWSYVPVEVAPIAANNVLGSLKALGCPNPSVRMTDHNGKQEPLRTDQNFFIVMAPFPPLRLGREPEPKDDELGKTKDGPAGRLWTAEKLSTAIKMIPGVLEVGLFVGYNGPTAQKLSSGHRLQDPILGQAGQKPVAVYFGMEDGTVKERKAT